MSEKGWTCCYCRKSVPESGDCKGCTDDIPKEEREGPLTYEESLDSPDDEREEMIKLCQEFNILYRFVRFGDVQPIHAFGFEFDELKKHNIILCFGIYDRMYEWNKDIMKIKNLIGNKRGPEFTLVQGMSVYDCSTIYILCSDDPRLDPVRIFALPSNV